MRLLKVVGTKPELAAADAAAARSGTAVTTSADVTRLYCHLPPA